MRRFYNIYPNRQTVPAKLSWSHYVELLSVEDNLARSFYEKQSINEKWSIRELKRQKNSLLFERIALNKDEQEVLNLSEKGQVIEKAEDLVKDPYILEFLKLHKNSKYTEKQIEQKIINNLQMFLLELGKGFTFVARQKRIVINNDNFYIDLLFYNIYLNCYIIIELKTGKFKHEDIGQMNFYLNYVKKELNQERDNAPIGILLCKEKYNVQAEFTTSGMSNKMFVSKYQLYLPTKEELEKEVNKIL